MNVKAFVGNLRTETEVAEAFFSASNGNMDMLNNMLGTQYKTFEALKKASATSVSVLRFPTKAFTFNYVIDRLFILPSYSFL